MSTIDILQVFEAGAAKLLAEGKLVESTKVGTLRAGNTGAVTLDNKVIGKCARTTYLRMKGIEIEEKTAQDGLMFALGHMNEEDWVIKLLAGWNGKILREEETPISWNTNGGITVTGRPDIVLCDTEGKPVHGIELKQIASLWTARDVGIQLNPKIAHLLQAAHYSMHLNVPFSLVYTSRVNFAVSGEPWAQKLFPAKETYEGDRLKFKERKGKNGEYYWYVKDILPFVQVYDMQWNDKGQLMYKAREHTDWTYTLITRDSITNYYNMIAQMDETDILPPRPADLRADGSKESFSSCNYCPLNAVCDSAPKGATVSQWLKLVRGGQA